MSMVTTLYSIHIVANLKVLNQDKFQNRFSVWSTLLVLTFFLKKRELKQTLTKSHALLVALFLEQIKI